MKMLAYSPKLARRMRLGLDRLNQSPCTSASRSNPSSRTTASESANSSVGSLHFTQAIEKLSTRRWRLMESRRSEEHTSELQSLMRISYAVVCLKNKQKSQHTDTTNDMDKRNRA